MLEHPVSILHVTKGQMRAAYEKKQSFLDADEWSQRWHELMNTKRTYTGEELRFLIQVFWSGHDECVLDNPGDFDRLQVASAQRTSYFVDELGTAAAHLMDHDALPDPLPVADVAKELGLKWFEVMRLIRQCRLRAFKDTGVLLVTWASIENYKRHSERH